MARVIKRLVKLPLEAFGLIEHWLGAPFYPEVKETYCQNQAPFRTPRV